jgi:hypothetical protein
MLDVNYVSANNAYLRTAPDGESKLQESCCRFAPALMASAEYGLSA